MGDSLDRHSEHHSSKLRARVRGAGPTGALAALALAEAGWQVELEDPLTVSQLMVRSRAYALTHSSRCLLQRLQLWEALIPALAPFRALELHDLELGLQVPFTVRDLGRRAASPSSASGSTSSESSGGDVGWVVRHTPLMELLLTRLEGTTQVQLALGSPGSQSPVDLLVAAEGAASSTRQALGLAHWRLPYSQSCLSVQVRLRGSASDQAWELFRAEGPFAVLPLGGDRFQLVWSGPAQRMRRLESLDPVAFLDRLAGALPDGLQADALLDAPRAFPAALELSGGFHRGNTVLVGETMHRCHPVGGAGPQPVLARCGRAAQAGRPHSPGPAAVQPAAGGLRPSPLARCAAHPAGHRRAGANVLDPAVAAAHHAPARPSPAGPAAAAAAPQPPEHDPRSLPAVGELARVMANSCCCFASGPW